MRIQHWKRFILLPTYIQDASTCHDDLCPLISWGFCLGQVFIDKKEHFGFHQNQLLPCYWSFQSCHLHIHQLGTRRQFFSNSTCPHPGSALTSCSHDPLNTYQRTWGWWWGCVHKQQACTHWWASQMLPKRQVRNGADSADQETAGSFLTAISKGQSSETGPRSSGQWTRVSQY